MKIVASAFPFGYGPASKLLVIAKQLRNSDSSTSIDFVGYDIALSFAQQNSQYYNQIIPFDDIKKVDPYQYDLAISVMNPYLIIWAYLNDIQTIYIDSLFWFWEWDSRRLKIADDLLEKIRDKNAVFSEILTLIKPLNSHELKYVAYQLSTHNLTQSFAETKQKDAKNNIKARVNRKAIGPIVDINHIKHGVKRNNVLISLAGTYSPLNREQEALLYADLALAALDDFVNKLPDEIDVVMTVNPDLVDKITPSNKRIKVTSLSHDEFLENLNTAKLLFAPAGVTTIYESAYYDVPIFFLPEQHDGHYKNYARLTRDGEHGAIFPNLLFNTRLEHKEEPSPDLEILRIQELIKSKLMDDAYINDLKETLEKFFQTFLSYEAELKSLASKQKSVLHEISGGIFDVNEFILANIERGGR